MHQDERLMAEQVSCFAAGMLLLISQGSAFIGACMRWPEVMLALFFVFLVLSGVGTLAAIVWTHRKGA